MAVRNESVRLTLEDAGFSTGMARAAAATALLDRSLNDLDGSQVRTDRSVRSLADDALPTLDRNARTTDRSINQLTGRLRLFADAAAVLGPALAPLGAAAVPALAAMSAQLGVLVTAGGTAALAFSGMGDAIGALNDYQLEPTAENLQAMRVEMEKLGPAGAQFVRFLDSLEPAFRGLQQVAREGMLPGVEDGITALLERLPQVRSIIGQVAATMGDLARNAGDGLAGDGFNAFFEYLDAEAGPILAEFGETVGNFAQGFANLIVGLGPLTSDFSGGLLEMSNSFAEWSEGIASSAGWQEFVAYVQQSGPMILDLFGSVANLFAQVAQAAAPLGLVVVPALTAMVDVIAALADSPLGTIFLTAAAGMAAYTRAASLVGAANARLSASTLSAATAMDRMRTTSAGLQANWKGIAAGAGMLALSMSDVDNKAGLSNTAMLGLAGTFAGPWGAAIGAGIGLTMDFAASNDDLTSSLDAVETALGNLSGNATASELRSIGQQAQDAEAKLIKLSEALNNPDSFSDILVGAKNAIEGLFGEDDYEEAFGRLRAAQAELDTAMSRSGQMAGLFGDAVGMTAGQMNVAADAAGAFSGALAEMNGWFDKREAMRNYRASIDELREGLKKSFSPETASQIDAVGRNMLQVAALIKDKGMRADFLEGARSSLESLAKNAGPKGAAAIQKVINKLDEYGMTRPKEPKLDVNESAARAKTQAVQRLVDKFGITKAEARALLNDLASGPIGAVSGRLSALDGRTATTTVTNKIITWYQTRRSGASTGGGSMDLSLGGLTPQADGGTVPKTGKHYADRHPYLLADGEEVISNRFGQADKHRELLKAINSNRLADGGTAGRRSVVGWQGSMAWMPGGGPDFGWASALDLAAMSFADSLRNLSDLNKREQRELERRVQREVKQSEELFKARQDEVKALRESKKAMAESVAGNFMSDVFGDINLEEAAKSGALGGDFIQKVNAYLGERMKADPDFKPQGRVSDYIGDYLGTLSPEQIAALTNQARGGVLRENASDARRFKSLLEQLRALGLDGGAFQALAESGNASAAEFYLQQGRSGIRDLERDYNAQGATALSLGASAAGAQYDRSIKAAERQVEEAREGRREAREHAQRLERQMGQLQKEMEQIRKDSPRKTGEEVGRAIKSEVGHGERKSVK